MFPARYPFHSFPRAGTLRAFLTRARSSAVFVAAFLAMTVVFLGGGFVAGKIMQGPAGAQNHARSAAMLDGIEPASGLAFRSLADKIVHKPDTILSLSGGDIGGLFSRPDFIRRDIGAVIWQYRQAGCVLDVYFYPHETSNDVTDIRASYYEIRHGQDDFSDSRREQANCLRGLRQRAGNKPTAL